MENLIDGRAIAGELNKETQERIDLLRRRGVQAQIVFVRVGEDAASRAYVTMKEQTGRALGLRSTTHVLARETTQADLLRLIAELNDDPAVHGILVQAPLPGHIDAPAVFNFVGPRKDVDGFHPINVGKLMLGDRSGFIPCTPAGVHELLIRTG